MNNKKYLNPSNSAGLKNIGNANKLFFKSSEIRDVVSDVLAFLPDVNDKKPMHIGFIIKKQKGLFTYEPHPTLIFKGHKKTHGLSSGNLKALSAQLAQLLNLVEVWE
ncbi:hypothetical protein [Bathymodiolus septemdierum thioautotrophic gill symbiont]|uniref:Uncharacterized protein n=1 Tax=endosymbiont of Bathymodiolus septemdierum str. Myojin knoll TaxID=1303921 RepID=A0A0P0UQY4_9GAMM|nr:hypothetical protein [Bathymodiolus septemdierum thioautotrophic gill symbiont]BAS67612.1 hypothetical protein BSEPE_0607 [endosymbiont of Bathymodiolus septemdierum str. Myojin knoll]